MTTLTIQGTNLNNQNKESYTLKASNPYMLINAYLNVVSFLHIERFDLLDNQLHSGNTGINAGAFLNEILEEKTNTNLS